jgi:hypothetical protein
MLQQCYRNGYGAQFRWLPGVRLKRHIAFFKQKKGKPRPMPPLEVMAGPFPLLPSVASLARQCNLTDLDFVLALTFASAPTTVAAHAVASAPAGEKKKAENPLCLSDEAYKVTVDIARSRLQVTPAPSAAVDSVLPGVRSPLTDPASSHGQPLVPLFSASADATGLGG